MEVNTTLSQKDAAVLEDRERLEAWLNARGLVPYIDFEILTVSLEEASVELDPMGNTDRLLPHLDAFAAAEGFDVLPFDPETGSVTLLRK